MADNKTNNTLTQTLGERIQFAREIMEMSRAELCAAVGAKGTAVYNWETDIRRPPADMIPKLAAALRVDESYFASEEPGAEHGEEDEDQEVGDQGDEDAAETPEPEETGLAIPASTGAAIPDPGAAIDVAWAPAPSQTQKALGMTVTFAETRRALDGDQHPPLFPEPPPPSKKAEEQLILGFPENLADLAADMEALALLIERERAQLLIAKRQYQEEKEKHGIDELEKELKEKKEGIAANQLRLEEMAKALRKKKAEAA
jgi:transcriptional regulator with XRE-family HTH domain